LDTTEKIALKYQEFSDALKRFRQSIAYFALKKEKHNKLNFSDGEDIEYTILRDAIILLGQ